LFTFYSSKNPETSITGKKKNTLNSTIVFNIDDKSAY